MKKNRMAALLLVIALLLGLVACGGEEAVSSTPASEPEQVSVEAAPEAPPEEAVPPEESAPQEEVLEEPVSVQEPEEPQIVIEYPLNSDHVFTMVANRNNITAEVFADGGFELTPVYEALSQATGITMEFEMLAEQTVAEKMNLIMASGDLPDLFNSKLGQYDNNYIGAIEDGILIDISEGIAENAPDYVRFLGDYPDVKAGATNGDGSMVAFVSAAVPVKSKGLNIRGDWLEDLGMEAPTTIDELTPTLEMFKSEKGATMPLLTTSEGETGLARFFQSTFTGFRGVGYQMTAPDSGEVVCIYAADGFIEYLSYLAELYSKGLITNDFLTTGREYGNFESTYLGGSAGVWDDGYTMYQEAMLALGGEGYDPQPFSLTGEECHVSDVSSIDPIGTRIFISTACPEPEIAMQLFNYCYTEEGRTLTNFGVEGVSYQYNDAGEIEFTELMTNNPQGWAMMLCKAFYTGMWLPTETMYRAMELNAGERAMAAINLWTETAGDQSMRLPTGLALGAEEQTEFAALASDVLTAVTEASSQVIVGDLSIDGYKQLLNELKGTGLDRMDELYQEAYDAFVQEV